ncbi:hypothetical protein JWJ90_18330 [Desulfobulbus rhabdoformis]|uniref:hypothetical protein n=1 Tax=Desulfobulbus rhabdoformis TaxID=34032 RepID=UPI001962CE45|nr:hypothetical protein [Desulfobulbus rhabdoformis]MBM9616229.1 hypothetical protein [Desulfobulbus rhabdoformis]
MKRLLSIVASAGMLTLGAAGIASAVPTTWTDVIDFDPDRLVPPTLSYYHDIADDGFSSEWMGGDDTFYAYELSISMYDDNVGTETEERGDYLGNLYGWGVLNRASARNF